MMMTMMITIIMLDGGNLMIGGGLTLMNLKWCCDTASVRSKDAQRA